MEDTDPNIQYVGKGLRKQRLWQRFWVLSTTTRLIRLVWNHRNGNHKQHKKGDRFIQSMGNKNNTSQGFSFLKFSDLLSKNGRRPSDGTNIWKKRKAKIWGFITANTRWNLRKSCISCWRNNEAVQFLALDTSLGDPLIRDGHWCKQIVFEVKFIDPPGIAMTLGRKSSRPKVVNESKKTPPYTIWMSRMPVQLWPDGDFTSVWPSPQKAPDRKHGANWAVRIGAPPEKRGKLKHLTRDLWVLLYPNDPNAKTLPRISTWATLID